MATYNIIATRQHKILKVRAAQLSNNLLALDGGRPYIDARLHRAPSESNRSWAGSVSDGIVGRRDRAYIVNDAGRIAQKINDHLFAKNAQRDGVDKAWVADVSTTGLSVRQFWQRVSALLTAGQWVWIQPDRGRPATDPATGQTLERSVADKDAEGDRVYWNIWNATEVVDWCFDSTGQLLWLITEQVVCDNSNPLVEAKDTRVRTLWQPGKWTRYTLDGKEVKATESGTISANIVPFVCIGIPSATPWWYDAIELIQCALLNLESLNFENLVQTVFPQLVVPASLAENIESKLTEMSQNQTISAGTVKELVREVIRGLEYPFAESAEEANITRYLMPDGANMKVIPDNQDRLRRYLFDSAGLGIFKQESKQVQSAEAKEWDHLDVEATLSNRSLLLQEGEGRIVEVSQQLDTSFSTYEPVWPHEFSVPTTGEDIEALTQLANFTDLPAELEREILRVVVHLLNEIKHLEPDRYQELLDVVDEYEPESLPPMVEPEATSDDSKDKKDFS